ncbi:MAG: ribose 5-phosphate isomerase B, partial [bacterium]
MKVVDEKAILELVKRGERIIFIKDALLTPAARDLIHRHRLTIIPEDPTYAAARMPVRSVAIGADHGGFELKGYLIERLKAKEVQVVDLGTYSAEAVDYPDFAYEVARQVAEGKVDRGVMIDSIGVASAMVSNKLRGVRAAPCWSVAVARSARSHNDANLITLGGKILSPEPAWEILKVFLEEPFSGGRHEKRVRKIEA